MYEFLYLHIEEKRSNSYTVSNSNKENNYTLKVNINTLLC